MECLRCLAGLAIIYFMGDWFMIQGFTWVVVAYLIFSVAMVTWFVTVDFIEPDAKANAI